MTDPIQITASSSRFDLPFLFAGQSQREFFVNEAFARIDSLLHPVIDGVASTPPVSPASGQTWLVATGATDEWRSRDDHLAYWDGVNWLFTAPKQGMRIFDLAKSQISTYNGGWHWPSAVAVPDTGSVQDQELRTVVASLIQALEAAGIISVT